jgi:CRISPR/Cas system-associated protein Cas7 (RAMP superfamily)
VRQWRCGNEKTEVKKLGSEEVKKCRNRKRPESFLAALPLFLAS